MVHLSLWVQGLGWGKVCLVYVFAGERVRGGRGIKQMMSFFPATIASHIGRSVLYFTVCVGGGGGKGGGGGEPPSSMTEPVPPVLAAQSFSSLWGWGGGSNR